MMEPVLIAVTVVFGLLYGLTWAEKRYLETELDRMAEEHERTVRELEHLAGMSRIVTAKLREQTGLPPVNYSTVYRTLDDHACSDDYAGHVKGAVQ